MNPRRTRVWPVFVLLCVFAALLMQANNRAGSSTGDVWPRLDEAGNTISASATQWACTVDPRTGLTWEVKTRDGGMRDMRWTYTPYDSDPRTNGGYVGYKDQTSGECIRELMPESSCNTEAYVVAMNRERVCGFDNWRLPSTSELVAVAASTSSAAPGASEASLPNTGEGWYWTGVERVGITAFSRVILMPPAAQPAFYDGSYLLMLVRD